MCTNRRNVRVGEVETAVFEVLEATLLACMGEVRAIVEEEIRVWASTVGDRSVEQRRELREADRKIANLVEALADSSSHALKAKLRELEDRRAELTRVLTGSDSRVTVLPSATEITRRVLALAELREAPADLAREQLRLMTRDGRINITPMPDRSFEVAGAANPAALLNPYTRPGLAASGCWEVVVAGALR